MPCKMLTPTIERIASEFQGKVKVGKLDTDSNRNVAQDFRITAIPTVILFKGGKEERRFVGLRREEDYKEAINSL
jgi:thioredoxin 1